MFRNLVIDPGVRCLVSAVGVLAFPLFWRVRGRGEAWPIQMLVPIRWLTRGVSVALFLAGGVLARSEFARAPYHGAQLIMLGASLFPLSDILARLAVGASAMNVGPAETSRYWRRTTQVGLMLGAAGVALHMGWARLP